MWYLAEQVENMNDILHMGQNPSSTIVTPLWKILYEKKHKFYDLEISSVECNKEEL